MRLLLVEEAEITRNGNTQLNKKKLQKIFINSWCPPVPQILVNLLNKLSAKEGFDAGVTRELYKTQMCKAGGKGDSRNGLLYQLVGLMQVQSEDSTYRDMAQHMIVQYISNPYPAIDRLLELVEKVLN
nr:hypothetical protein BaRGS_007614 [Batillaria attramentaria]